MSALLDVYTYAMVSFGAFFYLAGSVGLLRFPMPTRACTR